ncbi:MAG TPA: GGDEF domain-containing protein [Planctomycetota bacterium]|nr:GGDEF domain-containing protein [Planctomycetota bacterium]
MWKRIELFGALAIVPTTIGIELYLRQAGPLALAAAGSGVAIAGVAAFLMRRPSELRELVLAARERQSELRRQQEELQARVDVLSAEREISLIVTEELDFRATLDRVLSVTCDTLGGDAELWIQDGGRLAPRAVRRGGASAFDLDEPENGLVRRCFDDGCLLFESEGGRFHALAPLIADRQIVGVVRISSVLEENLAAREERSHRLSADLPEFSKFLALALKTPDLYTRAVQDGLTGLWTKRHFITQASALMEAANRYGDPLSLIMVDVDHFKKVNDTHGHVTGDKVLKGVAELLMKKVRGGSAYRYGGEEMAVLLPKADLEGAAQVAERLRAAIEAHKIAGVKVTASFGVAQCEPGLADPPALVEKADQALYRAKEGGRNRVVTAAAPPRPSHQVSRRFPRSA